MTTAARTAGRPRHRRSSTTPAICAASDVLLIGVGAAGIGAAIASITWFTALGFGAQGLAPVFAVKLVMDLVAGA